MESFYSNKSFVSNGSVKRFDLEDSVKNREVSIESNNSIDDGLSFINEMSLREFLFREIFQSNDNNASSIGSGPTLVPRRNNTFNFIPENNNNNNNNTMLSYDQGTHVFTIGPMEEPTPYEPEIEDDEEETKEEKVKEEKEEYEGYFEHLTNQREIEIQVRPKPFANTTFQQIANTNKNKNNNNNAWPLENCVIMTEREEERKKKRKIEKRSNMNDNKTDNERKSDQINNNKRENFYQEERSVENNIEIINENIRLETDFDDIQEEEKNNVNQNKDKHNVEDKGNHTQHDMRESKMPIYSFTRPTTNNYNDIYNNSNNNKNNTNNFEDNFDQKVNNKRKSDHEPIQVIYPCTICSYITYRKGSLTTHMRRHTGEKPYACTLCEYRASTKDALTVHMRRHTGEKPYACTLCDYRASISTAIIVHMRTHTGEKPFACTECDHRATTKSAITIHIRAHTGEKPFACPLCDYRASQKPSLKAHMNTHHL